HNFVTTPAATVQPSDRRVTRPKSLFSAYNSKHKGFSTIEENHSGLEPLHARNRRFRMAHDIAAGHWIIGQQIGSPCGRQRQNNLIAALYGPGFNFTANQRGGRRGAFKNIANDQPQRSIDDFFRTNIIETLFRPVDGVQFIDSHDELIDTCQKENILN
uniref:Uncharacterized protein n=1 Tax=Romanomermis culicivorax TaxID=13658 RepID=A0A915K1Z1_ROMCU